MGSAGYRDHIVVCGWNATAPELVDKLRGDEYDAWVVMLHEADMRSILTVLAVQMIAPQARTVVEVNNPVHVEHFERRTLR